MTESLKSMKIIGVGQVVRDWDWDWDRDRQLGFSRLGIVVGFKLHPPQRDIEKGSMIEGTAKEHRSNKVASAEKTVLAVAIYPFRQETFSVFDLLTSMFEWDIKLRCHSGFFRHSVSTYVYILIQRSRTRKRWDPEQLERAA